MNNSASQFMDKQIMDLANPQSLVGSGIAHGTAAESDFIDLVNRPSERKEDIVPSYDFVPIRHGVGPSSNFESGEVDTRNSFDSEINAPSIRSYGSHEADESEKSSRWKNKNAIDVPLNTSLVSEIDRIMKKYMDDLTHSVDNITARLSQLDTRTHNIENAIEDLELSVDNKHAITDVKMTALDSILNEVRSGVQFIKDKQETLEAQLKTGNLRISTAEKKDESKNTAYPDHIQAGASGNQQFSSSQFPSNQAVSVPHGEPYFSSTLQTPSNPTHQYPQPQPQSAPPPLEPQYQSYPQPQPQQLQPFSAQPPLANHPEEAATYNIPPPQIYPSALRPQSSQPPSAMPPPPLPQQFYGPAPNTYEPPPNRPGSGYSASFGPGESYQFNSHQPQYGSSSHIPPQQQQQQQHSSSGSYQKLPTARILPQALPTASPVGGGGSGNRVPIDDVVERVTSMGFSRDQVRAAVRKLTENGQAVDLNVVLDKLMSDGDVQAPRGWFGRG